MNIVNRSFFRFHEWKWNKETLRVIHLEAPEQRGHPRMKQPTSDVCLCQTMKMTQLSDGRRNYSFCSRLRNVVKTLFSSPDTRPCLDFFNQSTSQQTQDLSWHAWRALLPNCIFHHNVPTLLISTMCLNVPLCLSDIDHLLHSVFVYLTNRFTPENQSLVN